jgi:hypothetical protein
MRRIAQLRASASGLKLWRFSLKPSVRTNATSKVTLTTDFQRGEIGMSSTACPGEQRYASSTSHLIYEPMRRLTTLAAALICSGCATQYAVPQGAPTATLTLAVSLNNRTGMVYAQTFADASCKSSSNGTRLALFTSLDLRGSPPHSGIDITIPAGQPFVFSHHFSFGTAPITDTQSCTITQSFTPIAGEKYRSVFEVSHSSCNLIVRKEDSGGNQAIKDLRRVTPPCFDKFSG